MADLPTHSLREEELIDEADLDSLVREAIAQVFGCYKKFDFTSQRTMKCTCSIQQLCMCVQIIDADLQFTKSKVGQWSANIVEGCLKRFAESSKPFK